MSLTDAILMLVISVLLGLVGTVYGATNGLDFGRAFHDRVLARAARRLERTGPLPDTIECAYWSGRDYVRDAARLGALGYKVTTEAVTSPYITYHIPGRGGGRTARRRVPLRRVTYGRQSGSTGKS